MHDALSQPERTCPECRYDLRASQPDATGTFTCPECGEHWTLKSLQERREAASKKYNRLRDYGFGVVFPIVWIFWAVATNDFRAAWLGSGIMMVSYLAIVAVFSTPVQVWWWYQVATRFVFLVLSNVITACMVLAIVFVIIMVTLAFL